MNEVKDSYYIQSNDGVGEVHGLTHQNYVVYVYVDGSVMLVPYEKKKKTFIERLDEAYINFKRGIMSSSIFTKSSILTKG